ncbi:MAG: aminotransferase class V-fold PLP-dependent enzyme [Acidobacteria bacterium]|nr:aminotransferase class V-fold PLP-dependent enzyme [Acidobacteriota bacterium]
MGYEISAAPDVRIRYRDRFPVTERYAYMNHAAVAPLSRPAAEAMNRLAQDCLGHGAVHYDQWTKVYGGIRQAAARLINADPAEIAIVKNTSEGIATVAVGIDWRPGDKVVAFREEFPANYYPWKRLEDKGVSVEWCSICDPLDQIDAACRGARLLAISFVNYLSGYRVDLEALGEICRRRGAFFFVDAIQGLGAFPVDVRACGINGLAADAHKWLLGPEGCGLMYIQRDWLDEIEPVEFGWTNVAHHADYASRDMTLRPDAGRYECGTLNTIGCYGLHAALEFLLEVGVDNIAPLVEGLAAQAANGALRKGYELAVARLPAAGSGIVSFRKDGVDARVAVGQLKEAGIIAAPRQGWIRVSPHFYVSPEEVERLIDLLP